MKFRPERRQPEISTQPEMTSDEVNERLALIDQKVSDYFGIGKEFPQSYRQENSYTHTPFDDLKRLVDSLPEGEREIVETSLGDTSAKVLVKSKYKQGLGSPLTKEHVTTAAKLWNEYYLLPRTEPAEPEDYAQWAEACLLNNPSQRAIIHDYDASQHPFKMYRALEDIDLPPLPGPDQVLLIVPPAIQVTGEVSRTNVFAWDDLDQPGLVRPPIPIFEETAAYLQDRGVKFAQQTATERIASFLRGDQ